MSYGHRRRNSALEKIAYGRTDSPLMRSLVLSDGKIYAKASLVLYPDWASNVLKV